VADVFNQAIRVDAKQALKTLKTLEILSRDIASTLRDQAAAARQANVAMGSVAKGATQVAQGTEKAEKSTKGLTLSYNSFVRLVTSQVVSRAIGELVSRFGEARAAASDLEITIARLQTIDAEFRAKTSQNIAETLIGLS